MVEVFKTNVDNPQLAKQLASKLLLHFPHYRINFDLHDCDNILRIEGLSVCIDEITEMMNSSGYRCDALE